MLLHKDVDVVLISCSPHLQAPIATKALGIGKHVLCGSPAGPRERDALRMVHASRYYPRLMSLMCHGLRFLPAITRMRSLIEEGFIGRVDVCEVKVGAGSYVKLFNSWISASHLLHQRVTSRQLHES